MSELEIVLTLAVMLLMVLNLLQLQINNNFNRRFKIMADWLVSHDVQNKMFADWVDSATEILVPNRPKEPNYYDKSTTQTTKAPEAKARTC